MRANIILTGLAAASSTSASVLRVAADSLDYDWAVTNWDAGCAMAGCYYDFYISAAANETSNPEHPAWSAYCNGQGEGAPYAVCERQDDDANDSVVVAKLLASTTTANGTRLANIQVSVQYSDLSDSTIYWNFTGVGTSYYNQFVAPPQNFTISPSEAFGVA